jgi:hypothetical protein
VVKEIVAADAISKIKSLYATSLLSCLGEIKKSDSATIDTVKLPKKQCINKEK